MLLSEAPEGVILKVEGLDGDSSLVQRLIEMGFREGQEILLRKRSLFGGPLIIEFQSSSLALRKETAHSVKVSQ